jgi:hypothetical protein
VVLGSLFAWRHRRQAARHVTWVLAVLALDAAAYLLASRRLYGGFTPYASGSYFTDGELTVMGRSPDFVGRSWRLIGLLVDRGYGLAVWQPAWLGAVPALAWLATRRRGRAASVLPIVVPVIVGWAMATYVALTMHGWWFPGRQVVVVLPLAVLAIAGWSQHSAWRRHVVVGTGLLGVLSHGFLLVEGAQHRLTWAVDPQRTLDPALRLLRLAAPDLRRMTATDRAGLLLWAAALLALGWWSARRPAPGHTLTAVRPGPGPNDDGRRDDDVRHRRDDDHGDEHDRDHDQPHQRHDHHDRSAT